MINGKKAAEYNVTKTVDAASGNFSYNFVNLDDNKAAPVKISTGKNGKGIGAVVQVKNGRTISCKFAATRDTAVLNFLAQNNGVCHPR